MPDTSALYGNTALEEWASAEPATLVFVPTVISELDKHKTHHPSESVRGKADKLIRQIGELDRRGDLFLGVPLAGRLSCRALPVEPSTARSPAWMDLSVADDRILASAMELRWLHPEASVVLVTLDRNMRNKAQFAALPTAVPPTPSRPEPEEAKRGRRLPEVVLGHPSADISLTPIATLGEGEHRRLIRVEPRYPIENKGSTPIRDVRTGVADRAGRRHEFVSYRAQLIAGGDTSWVRNVGSIPQELLDDVHESAAVDAWIYWASFVDADGKRWEVVYDAETRTTDYRKPAG